MEMELKAKQSQTVSQNMVQQMTILQLSIQELSEYVNELTLKNPMADIEEPPEEDLKELRLKKLEWLAGMDEQNRVYYREEQEDSDRNEPFCREEFEKEAYSFIRRQETFALYRYLEISGRGLAVFP